jgi:hypothetical protein
VYAQAQGRQEFVLKDLFKPDGKQSRERSSVVAKSAVFGISLEAGFSRSFALSSLAALALAGLSLGCSSSDDPAPPGPGPGGSGGGPTIHPNARPCNISTGYAGDEYCIEPPAPGAGMQLHYGPKNYNDQEEVNRYLIQPNEEITDCVFVTTPNDTEVYFHGYHSRMRPGSHHLLLYVQETRRPESAGPERCNQGVDTRNIFGAQTSVLDVDKQVEGEENEGLAVKLGPNLQGVVQVHFINTSTEPMLREAWANLVYVDPASVTMLGDPIFFIGGALMNVPPGTTQVIKGKATAPSTAPADGIRLVAATGHYHAHTTRFSAWKTIGGQREPLMEDFDWHEPSLIQFNSKTKNALPNPAGRKAGGFSGIVALKAGDTIEWECEVMNDGDVPLTFGNEVYTAEMCNMFGLYAPSMGGPWSAFNP